MLRKRHIIQNLNHEKLPMPQKAALLMKLTQDCTHQRTARKVLVSRLLPVSHRLQKHTKRKGRDLADT